MIRGAFVLASAGESVAVVQQLAWHRAHGDVEPFGSVLVAHAGIYAGLVIGLFAATAMLARDARLRPAAALFVAGALVRLAALALDASAHRAGVDPEPAHDLYRMGIGAALVGLALAARRLAGQWAGLRGAGVA